MGRGRGHQDDMTRGDVVSTHKYLPARHRTPSRDRGRREKRRDKNHGSGPAGQAASKQSWGGHRANKRWSLRACLPACSFSFLASEPSPLVACNKRRTLLLRCAGVGWLDARVSVRGCCSPPAPLTRIWASPPGGAKAEGATRGVLSPPLPNCASPLCVPGSHTGLRRTSPPWWALFFSVKGPSLRGPVFRGYSGFEE